MCAGQDYLPIALGGKYCFFLVHLSDGETEDL